MGKILIIKGSDFSENSVGSVDIVKDFVYDDVILLMNYYIDDSGNLIKQESSSATVVIGALVEGYIPIEGQSITVKTSYYSIVRIAEYDANKQFIQRQVEQNFSGEKEFTLQDNTKFVRLGIAHEITQPNSSYEVFMQSFNSNPTSVNGINLYATSYITL